MTSASTAHLDDLRRIVVVGGSIAGVTAAGALRTAGWDGQLTLVGDESGPPYSRVPLSKGVLAGTHAADTALLPSLPADVEVRAGTAAAALRPDVREIVLADGSVLPYDGLVIATGARARRLAADGQRGERVVRTMRDAEDIAHRVRPGGRAVVVGGGFLGMEVATTLVAHGMRVTVVDREPPLERLLGPWLAAHLTRAALAAGVEIVVSEGGVQLVGDPISGVRLEDGREVTADLVVSAVGDVPNVEWLDGSGLALAGGVIADDRCRVAPRIVAAGDVVAREAAPGVFRRTPHWSNAVAQGRAAAASLLDADAPPYVPDHYFWTEQFGHDVKIAGEPPLAGDPEMLDGDPGAGSMLLRWDHDRAGAQAAPPRHPTIVAVNYRIPVAKLKRMSTGEVAVH